MGKLLLLIREIREIRGKKFFLLSSSCGEHNGHLAEDMPPLTGL
jgi:hypothetical protein